MRDSSRPIAVSVIIPTWNRAASLRDVLIALAQQESRSWDYEVLVVDNHSIDGTRATIESLVRAYPVSLRYLYESKQGRAHALNRALPEARGHYVAFTDDDMVIPGDWLRILCETARGYEADGVGGPIELAWLSPPPAWISEVIAQQLGMADYGAFVSRLDQADTPFLGANMLYRASLFAEYGGFSTTDPCEDSEFYIRMLGHGQRLIYQPTARLEHRVHGADLTVAGVARRLFRQGRGYGMRLDLARSARCVCNVPLWIIRQAFGYHYRAARCYVRGARKAAIAEWLLSCIDAGIIWQRLREISRRHGRTMGSQMKSGPPVEAMQRATVS